MHYRQPSSASPATSRSPISIPKIAESSTRNLAVSAARWRCIASENFVPRSVMEAQGSVLTNKYAEGYPGRRYYGGCEYVDVLRSWRADRARNSSAPSSRTSAALGRTGQRCCSDGTDDPGEKLLGLDLAHGGHLTHGMKLNFSGKLYDVASYGVSKEDHRIDMDEVRSIALAEKPKVISCRLVRVPASAGLRGVPCDRRRGRGVPVGGHGALRRTGCRRPAPVARPVRGRRLLDRPQDTRWTAFRPDPGEEGVGQEAQLRCLPGSAGWTAHARHRGQGSHLQDRCR